MSTFKGRHFDRSVILLCVRWYLANSLSLRNLEETSSASEIPADGRKCMWGQLSPIRVKSAMTDSARNQL